MTVLTSLDAERLSETWGRRIRSVQREVLRLAALVADAGAEGIVCSGAELAAVRNAFGDALTVVVPGVRGEAGAVGDQVRVVTPSAAARGGADYVVLGRTVTQAPDPASALTAMVQELAR